MDEAARQSAEQTRRMRAMMDSMPCGVIALDHAGQVLDASERATGLLNMALPAGTDFASALGDQFSLTEVLRREDIERGFDLHVDDTTLWVQANACADSAIGMVVTVTDVSPFSRSVDERAMSLRFLLHDLRSPLNSISALTQLDSSDPEAFERCGGMQQITQLAHYVLSLGEQFIFSSVAEHLNTRDFRRFDLRATLRQIASQLEVTATYYGVPLRLWLSDSSPVWVNGMRNFAARAIQNVIDNAVRASPRGDPVTVSLRHVDGFAEVIVNDRAGGLPGLREAGGRINRFDTLGKKSATGFGLGLKLAVQIVELHAGTLYAELNENGGTTFVLRLPCLNAGSARVPGGGSLVDADRALHASRE
ncbi:sensor histidine kinase [Paraburkholderia caffeinilytica]|uniref:sensor histidine kinase n=1 Tax=Paraburkholderia caffeinilytica TaxID=1761016 RepID=UPI003D9FECC0